MGSGAELLTGPGQGQPQDGGRQGQTGVEVEGHGGEALAQPLPQEHVWPDRGGEEPHSPPQPKLKVWRHGHSHAVLLSSWESPTSPSPGPTVSPSAPSSTTSSPTP